MRSDATGQDRVADAGQIAHASSIARRFTVAWSFLVVATLLGVGLRLQVVRPWTTLDYGHLLHAHSHVAFLGWVFNAFFAAALRHFIPPETTGCFDWLWWTMQVAVVGMLATFPFQGYGPASIAFSALHMGASVAFALRIWRSNQASPAARPHLQTALGFMLVSGLGPLALGPLAAFGLRDSSGYTLAIYFYLHCQYNGWFPFFLQALFLQRAHECGREVTEKGARHAARWLAIGCLFTYALSALWLGPSWWITGFAILGGAAQIIGCVLLYRAVRQSCAGCLSSGQVFVTLAISAWWLKHLLQLLAPWPGLADFAQERFVAIAFLHLVFLGLVTPALIAWALEQRWLCLGISSRFGAFLYFLGFGVMEFLLVAPTVPGLGGLFAHISMIHSLLAASVMLLAAISILGGGLFRNR